MIFQDEGDASVDTKSIATFINNQSVLLGLPPVNIDSSLLFRVIRTMYALFPHNEGREHASVFKQAAYFVCLFVSESPISAKITEESPIYKIVQELGNNNRVLNSLIAFEIVTESLHKATILRKDKKYIIEYPIELSRHSYIDIVDMLASGITPQTHFKALSVLFEQLVYKTNPDCQYDIPKS